MLRAIDVYSEFREWSRIGRAQAAWRVLRYVLTGDSGFSVGVPQFRKFRARHFCWWSWQKSPYDPHTKRIPAVHCGAPKEH